MKLLLQAIKSLIRKLENAVERVLNFFGGDGIIKQEHLPDGYPYGEIVEILPETTIEFVLFDNVGIIATPFALTIGNEYTVAWNGKNYTCIAQEHTVGSITTIAIGNIDGNTAEPFYAAYITADSGFSDEYIGQWAVVAHDNSASATISIVGDRIVKMDARYLPDEVSTTTADTVVTASMSAWSDNIITLSVTGVTATSKLEIGLSETATDEQYAAATAAQIRATGSGDGTVTLKAVAAPSVDLPILIRRFS